MKDNLQIIKLLKSPLLAAHRKKVLNMYDDFVQKLSEILKTENLSVLQKKKILQNLRKEYFEPNNSNKNTTTANLRKLFAEEKLDTSLYTDMIDAYEYQLDIKKISIWEELLVRERKKASPIARLWMSIYNENPSTYLPAENLCLIWHILDVLSHLKTDQSRYSLCLIPLDLIKKYQAHVTDFALEKATPEALEALKDIFLRLEAMQKDAQTLPILIKRKTLRFRVNVILSLTNFMIQSFKNRDVLQNPCSLSFQMRIKAFINALYRFLFAKKD